MPDMTADAGTLRAGGYTYRGWIATIPQTAVLTGAISAVPTYPALSLSYTVTTGSSSNVLRGMTVNVYDSGGRRKGILRVATAGTLNSTTLPVNEFSGNTVDIASGDTFAVVNEFRIWDKLVSATAAFNKDSRIAYTDQNADPYPTANGGGPVAGWVNGSSVLIVNFDGTTSFSNDPDNGGNSLTYAWDFIDATPSSSASATPSNIAFPPGFRHVLLSVTDGVNGEVTVKKIPVWAFKAGVFEPSEVVMSERSWDISSGDWRASFELLTSASADIAALPDGALVVYFEREFYQGVEVSYGSNVNRSNVKFTGFLRSETVSIEPEENRVTFNAVSLLTILDNDTPALPQLGIDDSTPDNWREIKTMSIRRFLWYLTYWHTTLGDLFDFVFVDGSDVTYQRLYVQNIASAGGQLRDIAKSLVVDLTADRNGRLLFVRDPNMLTAAERSARVTAYNFTTNDRLGIELPREHAGTTKLVKVQAITDDGKPVFTKSGAAPAPFGTGVDVMTRVIVPNGATARRYAGLRFARLNSLYNGQFVPKGATMRLPDQYDVFDPALRDYITETIAASSNLRGLAYSTGTRWTIEGISISYDAEFGAKDITATIDHETLGASGIDDPPPARTSSGIPSTVPETPTIDFPTLVLPILPTSQGSITLTDNIGRLCFICSDGTLRRTTDFGVANYTTVTPSGSMSGTAQAYTVNSGSPAYAGTGTAVHSFLATDNTNAVYGLTDLFGSPVLTLLKVLTATSRRNIDMAWAAAGTSFVPVMSAGTGGVKLSVSTDGGVTFGAETTLIGSTVTDMPGMAASAWVSGKFFTSSYDSSLSTNVRLYIGTSNGSVITRQTNIWGEDYAVPLYVPYYSSAETLILTGYNNTGPNEGGGPVRNTLMRGTIDTSQTDIGAVVASEYYGPPNQLGRYTMSSPHTTGADGKRFMYVGVEKTGLIYGVFYTNDVTAVTGATWTQVVAPSASCNYRRCVLLDPDGSKAILYGVSGAVGFWDGTTLFDYSLNLGVSTPEIIGVAG